MLRLLSHTKCDANTTDGINKTTNTKLAQNVFQAKIKTAKALIAREWAVQQNCQPTHTRIQAQAHAYTQTHTHKPKETNTAQSSIRTMPEERAPTVCWIRARNIYTHRHCICILYTHIANLLTKLVATSWMEYMPRAKYECERGRETQWVRARDGVRENSAAVYTAWERASGVRTAHESASAVSVQCCCCWSSCSG